jgi:hypothetical protein
MDERPPDLPPDPPYDPPVPPSSSHFDPPYGDVPPAAPALAPLPFEDRSIPWLNGMAQTVVLLLQKPREAFARMNLAGDLLRPVVFALVLGTLGTVLSTVYQLMFSGMTERFMPSGNEVEQAMKGGATVWLLACSPLIVLISLLVGTVIYHLFLMLYGGAKSGLAATLRVLSYAYAPMVLYVVPGCGSLVGAIWTLVLTVIGFSVAHRTSTGRAVLAVLTPVFLLCVCLGIAFSMILAAGISGLKGLGH